MHISIKILSWSDSKDDKEKIINLEVTQKDEVEIIEQKIQHLEPSLPTYKQLLLFAGQQLEDGHSLEQYGIEDNSILFLVIKPTGMVITIRLDVSGAPLLSMDVESTNTIADIKRYIDRVQPDVGKRSPKYDLYFNGKLLKESLELKDCGVDPESQSTLQLSKSLQLQIKMMARPYSNTSTISLSALSSDTVDGIKRRIVQTERLPNEFQYCLRFLGKKLPNSATFSDCKVQDGSILHIQLLQETVPADIISNLEQLKLLESVQIDKVEQRCKQYKFKRTPTHLKLGRRTIKHRIVAVLCFPCVLITECYNRRRRRDELRGYSKLPGDVIKTTIAEQIIANGPPTQDLPAAASPRAPAITFPIDVQLPTGNSITLQALHEDTVQIVKSKIENMEPLFPAHQQRLVEPGHCDDLSDGEVLHYHRSNNLHLVLKGKLVSVYVKKLDGLPGFLILYLEYFDTVQSIKERVNSDKNLRVPQSQQQLFLEENLLEDNLTLSQCGIKNGAQISVKVLAPSCQQLMNELLKDSVACRYDRFGIHLGLSPDTIECITMNHRDVYRCLVNIIDHWVNNYHVSWSAVVSALDQIDCRNMAETIHLKYNVAVAM